MPKTVPAKVDDHAERQGGRAPDEEEHAPYAQLVAAHRRFNRVLEQLSLGKPLPLIFEGLVEITEASAPNRVSSILLLDEKGALQPTACDHLPAFYTEAISGLAIGPKAGSCGAAAYLRHPVIAVDVMTDPNWEEFRALAVRAGLHACWSAPIIASDQSVLGAFAIYSAEPAHPTPWELEVLDTASHIASVAIEKDRKDRALLHAATHDALTGLENRQQLLVNVKKLLAMSQRQAHGVAVLFLDVDHLKAVNDTLGHRAGDALLCLVADTLRNTARASDVIARYGGDEFVVALLVERTDDAEVFRRRFCEAFNRGLSPELRALGAGVTIGLATSDATNLNAEALIAEADDLMYAARDTDAGHRQAPKAP